MRSPELAGVSLERGEADGRRGGVCQAGLPCGPARPQSPAKGTVRTGAREPWGLLEGQRLSCGTEVQMVPAHPPIDTALCRNCFALWLQIPLCLRKLSPDD